MLTVSRHLPDTPDPSGISQSFFLGRGPRTLVSEALCAHGESATPENVGTTVILALAGSEVEPALHATTPNRPAGVPTGPHIHSRKPQKEKEEGVANI